MSVVIGFDHVSKRYEIGARQRSFREAVTRLPFRSANGHDTHGQEFWALRDVTLEARRGDVLGLVGHNGAGKTTALKVVSGVTKPTAGVVRVNGSVSALIELGAGFHPDLTGRENIYLNAVILGLTRKEVDRKFNSIVEFAELEKFIDTPVKRYSSGMYGRLGFAVAAHTNPDLLLVDEVLGVGDTNFQRKCHDFIHRFTKSGRTALFVSHDLFVIEQLCTHLIWLDHGRVMREGAPGAVLPAYFDSIDEEKLRDSRKAADLTGEAGSDLRLGWATFTDVNGRPRDSFGTGEDIIVEMPYRADGLIERPHFCLGIVGPEGGLPLIAASMLLDGEAPDRISGGGVVRCRFRSVPLMPRVYDVWGEVWGSDRSRELVKWRKLGSFRIGDKRDPALQMATGSVRHLRAEAPIRVHYGWEY